MKTIVTLMVILLAAFSSLAGLDALEKFSPHFATNAPITWKAPVNDLPKNFWVYRKILPKIFPSTLISNAVVLGSLQDKGCPSPSTNEICLDYDPSPCGHPCTFRISPKFAILSYTVTNYVNGSSEAIPGSEMVIKRAWECAARLDIDRSQLVQRTVRTHFCDYNQNGRNATNNACGREILLSRVIDGISFYDGTEGFSIEFGSHGKIRCFSLDWPALKRSESRQTASPDQIVNCIKAHKTIMIPNDDEPGYFVRLKSLANARSVTITKLTPYYSEGFFGETPREQEPAKFVAPIAELEAVADLGNSSLTVRLFSPVLSSDVVRLLGDKLH